MGEYKKQILRDTKILLKKEDSSEDNILNLLIDNCISCVLSYCRLELLPYQLIGFVTNMAVRKYKEMYLATDGGGGVVTSITEGDRRIDFSVPDETGLADDFKESLKPFVNRCGRLVSEVISR